MWEGKIRIFILGLCIVGAALAGLSSQDDSSDTGGGLGSIVNSTFRALVAGVRTGWRGHTDTPPQPAMQAIERVYAAERLVTDAARPDHNNGSLFAERPGSRYRSKLPEERKVEQIIENTFHRYFKSYGISGRSLTLRMPFGLNYEREGSPGYSQIFYLGGKGTPDQLWPHIDSILASEPFANYVDGVTSPGDKVVVFELERKAYSLSQDRELLESLRRGSVQGTPTRLFVAKSGSELSESDVYNYLYAVASVGVDCSGFTFYIHDSVTQAYGTSASKMLAERWRIRPDQVAHRVGLWFYDPASGYTEKIEDRIEDLRPGDVILFRGSDGTLKHSAVIQSIDPEKGLLRYVQSTDWAVESDRGVHQSVIVFDPERPQVSLGHYSVIWKQQVRPPFDGELEPRDWLTDRDRYAWYTAGGGSLVVRLQYLASRLQTAEPRFYANISAESNLSE
jgi:hypothetical protein